MPYLALFRYFLNSPILGFFVFLGPKMYMTWNTNRKVAVPIKMREGLINDQSFRRYWMGAFSSFLAPFTSRLGLLIVQKPFISWNFKEPSTNSGLGGIWNLGISSNFGPIFPKIRTSGCPKFWSCWFLKTSVSYLSSNRFAEMLPEVNENPVFQPCYD